MEGFFHYLTMGWLWQGVLFTLQLTLYGFVGGLLLGGVLAAMQLTRFTPLGWISRAYVVIYRGTPLILQLVFVFSALPHVGISLPPLIAGSVALAMNSATFVAEIIRSAVKGIDAGQIAAARAMGLSPARVMANVIAPQAVRTSLPGLGNEVVATMKNSALASIIAVPELTLRTQQLASATFDYFEIYFATAVMYLVLTGILSAVQLLLEDALNLDRTHRPSFLSTLLFAGRVPSQQTVEPAPEVVVEEPVAESGPLPDTTGVERVFGDTMIQLKGVHKSYGSNKVLAGIDLSVRAGEIVALLGPSGSGKSTLLRTVNGLEPIDDGEVRVAGARVGVHYEGSPLTEAELAEQRRQLGVGMVFQHFNLFQHLTARMNVAGPLIWMKALNKQAALRHADELLDQVGMGPRAGDLPRRLSGGQQQRVGIARALANNPRVLLLDEPTSALDPELVAEVLNVIRNLAHTHGLTMIIATHQLRFAAEVADRVVVMADGRVVEQGPAREVIAHPQEELTRRFVTAMGAAEL